MDFYSRFIRFDGKRKIQKRIGNLGSLANAFNMVSWTEMMYFLLFDEVCGDNHGRIFSTSETGILEKENPSAPIRSRT